MINLPIVSLLKSSPSRHAISNAYLHDFKEYQQMYTSKMACTSIHDGCWLSCDHTFSSVANIGVQGMSTINGLLSIQDYFVLAMNKVRL